MEQMKIQFFNHACFSVEYKNDLLLCDPYLDGTAFNNGWDLIVEGILFEFDYNKNNKGKGYILKDGSYSKKLRIGSLKKIKDKGSKCIQINTTTKNILNTTQLRWIL